MTLTQSNRPSFAEAFRVWLKIGLTSFGGPAGQIALMHRILVEEKRWIGEAQFLHALNFCMLLPGPEAQQLATYIGWLLHGTRGGLVAGILFVLPGMVVILALSLLYALAHRIPFVDGMLFGLQAAVLAIVIQALIRIAKRALQTRFLYALAAMAFIALFALQIPFPLVIAAAALIGALAGRRNENWLQGQSKPADADVLPSAEPSLRRILILLAVFGIAWFLPVLLLWQGLGAEHVLTHIGVFFSKMAVVTFGGAYAVLAYVAQQAVEHFHWLAPEEMLRGLGLAETTPGPLILVLTFVGSLASFRLSGIEPAWLGALAGGLLATWVTFVPCFLWIFLGAPYIERLRHVAALKHALAAITAAVVGVILNLTVWFGLHSLFGTMRELKLGPLAIGLPELSSIDMAAALLSLAGIIAVFRYRLGLGWLLGAACLIGIALRI